MPTSERPTTSGWYWLRTPDVGDEIVEFVAASTAGDESQPYVYTVDFGEAYRADGPEFENSEWEGPIPSMDELTRWRTERTELLAVMRPFARVVAALDDEPDEAIYDCWHVLDGYIGGDVTTAVVPSIGDVRRMAEAYRKATSACGGQER